MDVDRFGNVHAPNLSYACGNVLRGTEDDFQKLQVAWSLIRKREVDGVYIFTGLEHGLPLAAEELQFADDELASALSFERLRELALDHLGGSRETDDVAVFNRLTGATMATHLTLVKPGDVVFGVSASHSHPSVVRAAGHVGARFIDSGGLGAFRDAIATERTVALVVLTRLAVTYDLLPLDVITKRWPGSRMIRAFAFEWPAMRATSATEPLASPARAALSWDRAHHPCERTQHRARFSCRCQNRSRIRRGYASQFPTPLRLPCRGSGGSARRDRRP